MWGRGGAQGGYYCLLYSYLSQQGAPQGANQGPWGVLSIIVLVGLWVINYFGDFFIIIIVICRLGGGRGGNRIFHIGQILKGTVLRDFCHVFAFKVPYLKFAKEVEKMNLSF